jgi:hypothetical protein
VLFFPTSTYNPFSSHPKVWHLRSLFSSFFFVQLITIESLCYQWIQG